MERNILKMTHGSLFSGIGGFDLAAEWMGWDNIFHCEWNPFGQKVLKHHFPNSISYNDITKTDFSIHRGKIDILTGGFPCQPYSTAGLRKGKEDERHLFPEMLRCIKEVKPRWIIGENVRGLVSWNGGLVFHEVYDDLEREGYEVQSFLIPAASVNAPHQRYRIWFVAFNTKNNGSASFRGFCKGKDSESIGICPIDEQEIIANANGDYYRSEERGIDKKKKGVQRKYREKDLPSWEFGRTDISNDTDSNRCRLEANNIMRESEGQKFTNWLASEDNVTNPNGGDCEWVRNEGGWNSEGIRGNGENEYVADPSSIRLEQCSNEGEVRGATTNAEGEGGQSSFATETISGKYKPNWDNFPTKSPICGGDDGIPRELDSITFSKWRNESIKAYGNAIVPQVAHQIFKTIEQFENSIK